MARIKETCGSGIDYFEGGSQYNSSKSSNVWYQSCPSWNEFLKSLWSSGYEGWDWGNHKISRGALNMGKNLWNSILCRRGINNPNK